MKNFFIALIVTLGLTSCTKSNDSSDKYYVRYYSSTGREPSTIVVETETGEQTFHRGSSTAFDETFGPVSKGFNCKITASPEYGTGITVRIYVSKNSDPSLLKSEKKSTTYSQSLSTEYTIDF